jgi:hypothetical protein
LERRRSRRVPSIRVPIADAIECMVATLSRATADVLLCSTVFGGYVGPGDCHLLSPRHRSPPSDEVLLYLARRTAAECVLFGSRSYGPIDRVHDEDLELTERLLGAGIRNGILIVDHIVVADNMFRFMSEATGGWGIAPQV